MEELNSLFYNGLDRGDGKEEGDIFINCAYSKFFLDMKKLDLKDIYKILVE